MVKDYINIDQIIDNNISGSTEVLDELIQVLRNWLKALLLKDFEVSDELEEMSDDLLTKHGDFAVLVFFLNELHLKNDKLKNRNLSSDSYIAELQQFITKYSDKYSSVNEQISLHAVDQLDLKNKTILSHSQSGTVAALMHHLALQNLGINVIQTESPPANEGKIMGKRLTAMGIPLKLIQDEEIEQHMDNIDMAIVSADRIHLNYFVNKQGTTEIARACQKHSKPLYVLSDHRKLWKEDKIFKPRIKAYSNKLYTNTPNELVTSFVLPTGLYSPEQMVHLFGEQALAGYFKAILNR